MARPMSFKISNAGTDKKLSGNLTARDIHIYDAIMYNSQQRRQKTRKVTIEFLMQKCRCSDSTVYRALSSLKKYDLIEKYGDYITLVDFWGTDRTSAALLKKLDIEKQKKYYIKKIRAQKEPILIPNPKSNINN